MDTRERARIARGVRLSLVVGVLMGQVSLGIAVAAETDDLDAASLEALAKTQELLTSPALRDQAIAQSANAQTVDAYVRSLVGNGAGREQIYAVSSSIFEDLVRASGGDAAQLKVRVDAAKGNPQGFFESLSPENQRAIRSIAGKASGSAKPAPVR